VVIKLERFDRPHLEGIIRSLHHHSRHVALSATTKAEAEADAGAILILFA
jgi:hypothetical protein